MMQGFVIGLGLGLCVLALLARGVMGVAMAHTGDSDGVSNFLAWLFCLPIIIFGLVIMLPVLLTGG